MTRLPLMQPKSGLLHSFQHEARNSLQLQMVTSAGPHISVEAMDKYKHVYWDGDGR